MPNVLISTTALWNCGDDFIREGVLRLLKLKAECNQIWWNRGFGIESKYSNDLEYNLSFADYIVIAGTPQWMMLNERLFEVALKRSLPVAIIGVGTNGIVSQRHKRLLSEIATKGLCEIASARDRNGLNALKNAGLCLAKQIIDPAYFCETLQLQQEYSVFGWRDFNIVTSDPRFIRFFPLKWLKLKQQHLLNINARQKKVSCYDQVMVDAFNKTRGPKVVLVHDNRELDRAVTLFGAKNVAYFSDHKKVYELLAKCKHYIGSRIHGAIPAFIHGARVQLIYEDCRWEAIALAKEYFREFCDDIDSRLKIHLLDESLGVFTAADWTPDSRPIRRGSEKMYNSIRAELLSTRSFSKIIES